MSSRSGTRCRASLVFQPFRLPENQRKGQGTDRLIAYPAAVQNQAFLDPYRMNQMIRTFEAMQQNQGNLVAMSNVMRELDSPTSPLALARGNPIFDRLSGAVGNLGTGQAYQQQLVVNQAAELGVTADVLQAWLRFNLNYIDFTGPGVGY